MDEKTYIKVLEYTVQTGQRLLNLHNFGDALLHPDLERFISLAHGYGLFPGFSTNGIALTEKMFKSLVKAGLQYLIISLHTKKALDIYRRILPIAFDTGCFVIARAFDDNPMATEADNESAIHTAAKHDFAGTAPDKTINPGPLQGHMNCDFIEKNYFVVLYDGTISACCMDESGATRRGGLDNITEISHESKYKLCESCDGMRFMDPLSEMEELLAKGGSVNLMKKLAKRHSVD